MSTPACPLHTDLQEEMTARFKDDNEDAERMCPGELSEQAAYSQHLKDEMTRIDEDLIEAEAKNRLYYLLSERTRCVTGAKACNT